MGEHDERDSAGIGTSLPAARAFVVQFSADTRASVKRFAGRVEHIESGHCRRFATLEELVAFVTPYLGESG